MKKKIKKVQIFRHLIQLALFFLLPGLYVMAFSEIKSIYQMMVKGNFSIIQILPSLTELLAVVFITVILGRFFCGWLCAFGAYNDLIYEISKNVFKIKYKVNKNVDSLLKYLKYLVLLLIVILIWTMGSSIFISASPWDAFSQITDFPQVFFDYTIGVILFVIITIGAAFIERFFCRYLCPLGALFTIFSKINMFKIIKPSKNCGSCRACTNNCSMGIQLYKKDKVRGGECINCLKCVEACPRKNVQTSILDIKINPLLVSSVVIALFVGVYSVSNVVGIALTNRNISSLTEIATTSSTNSNPQSKVISTTSNNTSTAQNITTTQNSKYKDGTYTGSASGFKGGTTTVSVTVSNGKITNVNTISQQDTPNFYQRVESLVMNQIISTQSTSVDTVSGATYSSRGIINAVADALSKAN